MIINNLNLIFVNYEKIWYLNNEIYFKYYFILYIIVLMIEL